MNTKGTQAGGQVMVGNTIIVIFVVIILGQTFTQALERRKFHRELMDRLDQLEAKLDRQG